MDCSTGSPLTGGLPKTAVAEDLQRCSNSARNSEAKEPCTTRWPEAKAHEHGPARPTGQGLLCSHCIGFFNGEPNEQQQTLVVLFQGPPLRFHVSFPAGTCPAAKKLGKESLIRGVGRTAGMFMLAIGVFVPQDRSGATPGQLTVFGSRGIQDHCRRVVCMRSRGF